MWQKLPIWFRAVVSGLLVAGIPTTVWAVLAVINMRATPRVPWAAPVMAVLLWLYWRLLRRDERLRGGALSPRTWRLALLAGGAGVAAVWASFAALRGVLHITPPSDDVTKFPLLIILASLVMGSAVAGVCEESGFRGFMQLPLERAYGPVTAIGVTSVVFTLVHLTHGRPVLPFLPFFFVVAVVYGILTFTTGSILPSMTLHFAGDVLMFALRYAAARAGAAPATTGTIALAPALAAIAFAAACVVLFRMLVSKPGFTPAAPTAAA